MIELMEGRSRGQLLIVTGVVIAALIIALALVFNAALFTEAQSTSVTFSDTAQGNSLKETHTENIAQAIQIENEQMDGEAPANVEAIIQSIGDRTSHRQSKYGAVASVDHDSTTTGERIVWTDPTEEFVDGNGNETWNVTKDIGNIRVFSLSPTELPSLSDPSPTELQSNAFGITFNPIETVNQTAYLYEDSGDFHIRSVDESGSVIASCRVEDGPETSIQFTTQTLVTADETAPCRHLWPTFNVATIQFENGNTASGEFEYVLSSGTVAPDTDGHSNIDTATAVYATTVAFEFTTDSTEYTTVSRIARGEP